MSCSHEKTQIRIRTYSNGSTHYVPQCLQCGGSAGNAIPKLSIDYIPVPWDVTVEISIAVNRPQEEGKQPDLF